MSLVERRYPKTPMSGVGAIVVGRKGVLLVRRGKDPGKGLWSIPGGVIEIGEHLRNHVSNYVAASSVLPEYNRQTLLTDFM